MKTNWPVHSAVEIAAVTAILESGKTNYWSDENGWGKRFELAWKQYTTARHAFAVSSGTTALECAIHALQLEGPRGGGPEQVEVIVPCRTFMATAAAVVMNGHRVGFADIDRNTLNVTAETLETARTMDTAAVIVVHYAGLPCDMVPILHWARKHNIRVIEDCAHAHGATINGQHVGTFGDVGCFSFCLGKIMSTGGEGGMIVTDSAVLAERIARYRDHGKYQMVGSRDFTDFQWTVDEYGSNIRMTEMQSAIGLHQLWRLDDWNKRRREIAKRYDEALLKWSFGTDHYPRTPTPDDGRVYYMYVAQVSKSKRAGFLKRLNENGIPARIGGCPNITKERAVGLSLVMPGADISGECTVALPIYPTMTDSEVEEVITAWDQVARFGGV